MKMTLGQIMNDTVKFIYRNNRNVVNSLVKAGKLTARNTDKAWVKKTAKDLTELGMKLPKKYS